MSFHTSMSSRLEQLAGRYGKDEKNVLPLRDELENKPLITAFQYPLCAVVTSDSNLQAYRWGLVPFWSKDEEEACRMKEQNLIAPAEGIFESPSFRIPVREKRCIIPTTGFYYWRNEEDGSATPYLIYENNREIFSLAGIYDQWTSTATGQTTVTFSIITTRANSIVSYVHNGGKHAFRMPAVLKEDSEEKWLDPHSSEAELTWLLNPIDDSLLDIYPICENSVTSPPVPFDTIEISNTRIE